MLLNVRLSMSVNNVVATEFEYQYYGFNKSEIITNLIKIGAKRKDAFLFRVMCFNPNSDKRDAYLRVRDEGHRITKTFKYKEVDGIFDIEDEIIIDDFDKGCQALFDKGYEKSHYYEKIREIWIHPDAEIVFDQMAGQDEIMEIESHTLEQLNETAIKLGVEPKLLPVRHQYEYHYGIVLKNVDITFKTAFDQLTKNEPKMNHDLLKYICNLHLQMYNDLMNRKIN